MEPANLAEAAFRAHPEGVQVYRLDPLAGALVLVYANPAVDRLLGLHSAGHRGAALERVLPSARQHGLAQACFQALEADAPASLGELEWIAPGLEPHRLAVTVFPCLAGCVGLLFEDVTPSRSALEALEAAARKLEAELARRRRSEQRLGQIAGEWSAVFDALPDPVAVIDGSFRFRRVNAAVASLAGCEPRDLVGRKCHEVMHGTEEPWEGCPHQACLRAGAPVTRVIEDAAIGRPLLVTCAPLLDQPEQAGCSVHIARDLSDQWSSARERETLIRQLQEALAQVQTLSGLIPICAWCKKIRNDAGYWEQLEGYFQKNSQVLFTHCICPECAGKL